MGGQGVIESLIAVVILAGTAMLVFDSSTVDRTATPEAAATPGPQLTAVRCVNGSLLLVSEGGATKELRNETGQMVRCGKPVLPAKPQPTS